MAQQSCTALAGAGYLTITPEPFTRGTDSK
jgi:hypothetical protein